MNLNYMSDKDVMHFTFHSKSMIYVLVEYCKNSGIKKGTKLSILDKIFIFLMRIRINVTSKTLAFFFEVHDSTIRKILIEIEESLTLFSSEYGNCYNSEEIILEHTSEYARRIHGENRLILLCDSTYIYRSAIKISLSFKPLVPVASNWRISVFEKRLRETERSCNAVDSVKRSGGGFSIIHLSWSIY